MCFLPRSHKVLKITYLHQYFATPAMAGGTRSFELGRRLVAMGHDVTVITTFRGNSNKSDWFITKEQGLSVHWLPLRYSNKLGFWERLYAFVKFAFSATKRASAIDADIIYATSTPLTIGIPAVLSARKLRIPLVFEIRDLWPDVPISLGLLKSRVTKSLAYRLEKWIYANSSAIVTLAPGMKAKVVAKGVPEKIVGVIPNGCNYSQESTKAPNAYARLKAKHAWLRNGPLVLYAGTFGEVNDTLWMVRLANACSALGFRAQFVMVGDGSKLEKTKALASDLGVLGDSLHFLPEMPKSELDDWYAVTSFMAILYCGPKAVWEDSVSNKLFDAMSWGIPTVANIDGWGPSLVARYCAGMTFQEQSMEEISKEISRKYYDDAWMKLAHKNSLEFGRKFFSRDEQAERLSETLCAVHSGRSQTVATITQSPEIGIY